MFCIYVVRCAIWFHLHNLKKVIPLHAGPIQDIGRMGAIFQGTFSEKRAFCLLAFPKQKLFLTFSNENIFSKTQGTRLGAKVAPNKVLEQALPWIFFTFFKLYKWYQIAQRISYFLRRCKVHCIKKVKFSIMDFFCKYHQSCNAKLRFFGQWWCEKTTSNLNFLFAG